MCFNKETSLVSFLFSFTLSVKLFTLNKMFAGTLLLGLSLMQLVEVFLWTYVKNKKINLNISSYIIPGLIILQPILATLGAYYDKNKNEKMWSNGIFGLLALYVFLFIFYLYKTRNKQTVSTISKKTCRLEWNIFQRGHFFGLLKFLMVLYFIIVSYSYVVTENYDLFIVFWACLFITVFYLYMYNHKFMDVVYWGSLWCFLVNFTSMTVLAIKL